MEKSKRKAICEIYWMARGCDYDILNRKSEDTGRSVELAILS